MILTKLIMNIFSKSNTYDSPSVDVVDDDNNAGYVGGGNFVDDL